MHEGNDLLRNYAEASRVARCRLDLNEVETTRNPAQWFVVESP